MGHLHLTLDRKKRTFGWSSVFSTFHLNRLVDRTYFQSWCLWRPSAELPLSTEAEASVHQRAAAAAGAGRPAAQQRPLHGCRWVLGRRKSCLVWIMLQQLRYDISKGGSTVSMVHFDVCLIF